METVAMITSVTYQMHSYVLGFLGAWKFAQYTVASLQRNLGGQFASANTATAKPFPCYGRCLLTARQ